MLPCFIACLCAHLIASFHVTFSLASLIASILTWSIHGTITCLAYLSFHSLDRLPAYMLACLPSFLSCLLPCQQLCLLFWAPPSFMTGIQSCLVCVQWKWTNIFFIETLLVWFIYCFATAAGEKFCGALNSSMVRASETVCTMWL